MTRASIISRPSDMSSRYAAKQKPVIETHGFAAAQVLQCCKDMKTLPIELLTWELPWPQDSQPQAEERLTVKGGLNEGVSWLMASNIVLSAYMRDQNARPPLAPFSFFTLVVASLATVQRVSVGFTSWAHHSRLAPCPPWAAVTGGSTCAGRIFSQVCHVAGTVEFSMGSGFLNNQPQSVSGLHILHSREAPCLPWAANFVGSTCAGSSSFVNMHCAATKPWECQQPGFYMCRQHHTAPCSLIEAAAQSQLQVFLLRELIRNRRSFTQRAGEAGRAHLLAHAGRALQQQGLGQRELFGLAGGSGHSRGS